MKDSIRLKLESVRERFERVRDLRFFAEFNETELWEVVNACHWHEFSQGESIIKEGDVDSSFFVMSGWNSDLIIVSIPSNLV